MKIIEQIIEQPSIVVSDIKSWIAFDNLESFAKIAWNLLDKAGAVISSGSVGISGEDYLKWSGDNKTAHEVAAKAAGVTLMPEPEPEGALETNSAFSSESSGSETVSIPASETPVL